jgi:26S proteasome regulatory subunit N8
MLVKTNDMHLVMYVSSLVRSIIALHGLLNNKIKYRDVDEVLDRSAGVEMTADKEKEKEKDKTAEDKDNKDSTTQPSGESK